VFINQQSTSENQSTQKSPPTFKKKKLKGQQLPEEYAGYIVTATFGGDQKFLPKDQVAH